MTNSQILRPGLIQKKPGTASRLRILERAASVGPTKWLRAQTILLICLDPLFYFIGHIDFHFKPSGHYHVSSRIKIAPAIVKFELSLAQCPNFILFGIKHSHRFDNVRHATSMSSGIHDYTTTDSAWYANGKLQSG